MPLPVIAAAWALGTIAAGGAGAGGAGLWKIRGAKRKVEKSQHELRKQEAATARRRKSCEQAFSNLGKTKVIAMSEALVPFHEAFSELREVDFHVAVRGDGAPELDEVHVRETGLLSVTLLDGFLGVATAAAAGASASAATTIAIGNIAVASTGTAISSLSGVAASNATLAWLGGGPIAAGGGGMALGSVMATGIATAPALLVGGAILFHKGTKAMANADRYSADAAGAIAKHRESQAVLSATRKMAKRASDLLERLTTRIAREVGWLDTVVERETDWRKLTDTERERIRSLAILAMAASGLVHTPIVNSDGELTAAIRGACDHAATIAG